MASASSETNFYAPPKGSEPREISDDELAFISAYTNESDLNSLRQHIISIWKRSVEQFHVYRCIQQLAFLNPRIINNPIYKDMISRRDVKQLRIADIGCAFGQDTRKMIMDGVPAENITAIDVVDVYWNMGLELFKDKLKTPFIVGDFAAGSDEDEDAVSLAKYNLTEALDYAVSDAVLHVLSKTQVMNYLSRTFRALKHGGMFYGYCVGSTEAGEWSKTPDGKATRFLHTLETLEALLKELGYVEVNVISVDRSVWSGSAGGAGAAAGGGRGVSWEPHPNEPQRPGEQRHLVFVAKKA